MELHRADTEVRDIVDGKYDWRIERFENHRGDDYQFSCNENRAV